MLLLLCCGVGVRRSRRNTVRTWPRSTSCSLRDGTKPSKGGNPNTVVVVVVVEGRWRLELLRVAASLAWVLFLFWLLFCIIKRGVFDNSAARITDSSY